MKINCHRILVNPDTLRIKRSLVVVSSVLIALMLMTTISYNATYAIEEAPNKQITMPEVSSSSYIVMSGSTSEVVVSHHAERKMHPGKITMVLAAMVVLDNMYNDSELANTVRIDDTLAEYGDTFATGEAITVGDLLSAMLISGNGQAAEALASYSASKRSIFIKEMNSKTMELGLLDSHFTNPSGSYNMKQYSTAHDLAKIIQAAERYPLIKQILGESSKTIQVSKGKESRDLLLTSTNPFLDKSEASKYQYAEGGILGESSKPSSSAQFAGFATIDEMKLIVILMDSKHGKVALEAKGLFEYGNSKVTRNTIVKADKRVGAVRVRGGAITKVPVYTQTKGFAYVPPEGSDDLIKTEIYMYKNLQAPLAKGEKVGEYRIVVADEVKGTVDLVIKQDVKLGWWPSRLYISNPGTVVIGGFLALIICLIIALRIRKMKRKRELARRKREKIKELALAQLAMEEDRRARNWNYGTQYKDYNGFPPRTQDIRKEAIQEALDAASEDQSMHEGDGRRRRSRK